MKNRRYLARSLIKRLNPPRANIGDGGAKRSPAELRLLADGARTRRDFDADAFYRRRLCEIEPDRASNWVQLGHALKEAGFHRRALIAYKAAITMRPEDPELQVHLGHLGKVSGDFVSAESSFAQAASLQTKVPDEVAFQLRLFRKIDNSVIFHSQGTEGLASSVRYYLSVPGGEVREGDKASLKAGLGHGDYSYAFAMQAFAKALKAMDADFVILGNPEYVSDIRQRSDAEINVHFCFYPPERLRLLKGAYNINCFAWEFDRLRSTSEVLSGHAFADQATMLNLVDEIWMPSAHGASAVRPAVSTPVHVAPAPLIENVVSEPRMGVPAARPKSKAVRALSEIVWQPLAIAPRIQPEVNGAAKARESRLQTILDLYFDQSPAIFVTVFNAHDYRKQIAPMIRGFVEFLRENPNAVLLCKITTVDKKSSASEILLREQFNEIGNLLPPIISEKIWLTRQVLTREEMTALYDVCDHYICTSHAEGQNLPLIESMARGVVPVSVAGTAMDDYISDETAIVIASEPKPFGKRLTERYGIYGLTTHFTSPTAVAAAMSQAVALSPAEYASRSRHGLAVVKDLYGLERFRAAITELEQRLSPERGSVR